jgi:hypothetical protein
VVAACGPPRPRPGPPPTADAYPGTLRSPALLPVDFLWRQQVTARWGKGERRGFQAVLQHRGAELKMVALSPVGQPGFVITLDGEALSVVNNTARELPFPARFIMLDVQRAYFPWLQGDPPADGERRGQADGEEVVETWVAGRLVERTFRRLDGQPAGLIRVRYAAWHAAGDAPAKVTLDNGWFGYRLEIETVAQQRLPPVGVGP